MIRSTYCILLLSCIFLFSCTKNFEETNTDPNRPKKVTPGVMLGQLQYRMVNSSIGGARNFTHELMQVSAPRVSTGGGGLHRYIVAPGAGVWNSFYGYMKDIEDIYAFAGQEQENNYKGIALIYKSWAYSMLTDLYGDVPFSQATQAESGTVQPAFDRQFTEVALVAAHIET